MFDQKLILAVCALLLALAGVACGNDDDTRKPQADPWTGEFQGNFEVLRQDCRLLTTEGGQLTADLLIQNRDGNYYLDGFLPMDSARLRPLTNSKGPNMAWHQSGSGKTVSLSLELDPETGNLHGMYELTSDACSLQATVTAVHD